MPKYNTKTQSISYDSPYLKADKQNKNTAIKNSDKITFAAGSAIIVAILSLSLIGTVGASMIFDTAIKLIAFGALTYVGTKLIQYLVIKK